MAEKYSSKLSENWQEGKTLSEYNLFLLENMYSDVTFRLHRKDENKKEQVVDIPALRIFCLARSPVFFAMFAGELAQQLDNPIHDIHDDHAEPEAFRMMIRFMYSDDVMLTADNLLAIMYLSQKYIVSTLTKRCLQFLEENLTPDTAPVLLEQSILYEEKELKEKALTAIQEEAPAALASAEFLDISKEALGEVLNLNLRVATEVTVFDACMQWAKNQCEKLKISPSGENTREVLGSNLYQIRFPTMSLSEFTDKVVPQGVLTSEEGYEVFRCMTSESYKPSKLIFPTQQRAVTHQELYSLLASPPYTEHFNKVSGLEMQNHVTAISCTITKPICIKNIFIAAVCTSGFLKPELTVTLKQNGKHLLHYTGQPTVTTGMLPEHYAVDADDVRVESGALEVSVNLKISRVLQNMNGLTEYNIKFVSPETSKLSDNYVSITFHPVRENLLMGIQYRKL